MLKFELTERGTKHPESKMFAQSNLASDTARRLAISVTVFRRNGSQVQFWADRGGAKAAEHVHQLVKKLEAFQAQLASKSSHGS